MHVYMYMCVDVFVCSCVCCHCMHAYTCVRDHAYVCTCSCVYMCICMWLTELMRVIVYVCACMCVYTFLWTCLVMYSRISVFVFTELYIHLYSIIIHMLTNPNATQLPHLADITYNMVPHLANVTPLYPHIKFGFNPISIDWVKNTQATWAIKDLKWEPHMVNTCILFPYI